MLLDRIAALAKASQRRAGGVRQPSRRRDDLVERRAVVALQQADHVRYLGSVARGLSRRRTLRAAGAVVWRFRFDRLVRGHAAVSRARLQASGRQLQCEGLPGVGIAAP